MTTATKHRDKPHARIYCEWLRLPAWRHLSPHARALLVEMFAGYRPGLNGFLEWPQSAVASLLRCGNVKAAATLVELEKAGWIEVTRAGTFSGNRLPTRYRLTFYPCSATGDPGSMAFLTAFVPPKPVLKRNRKGANGKQAGRRQASKQVLDSGGAADGDAPLRASEALRNVLLKQGIITGRAGR